MKSNQMPADYAVLDSPLGKVLVAGRGGALTIINFQAGWGALDPVDGWNLNPQGLAESLRQLEEYFSGERRTFSLDLKPKGTGFQQEVWEALKEIPYGQIKTYGGLAKELGKPKAARAVGAAIGRNPLPVVIPCHRVVGHNGNLTGFYGGLHLKEKLLELEKIDVNPASLQMSLQV